jgi:hypothetical protein
MKSSLPEADRHKPICVKQRNDYSKCEIPPVCRQAGVAAEIKL